MVRPALARLTARHPGLKVRVICSAFPAWPEINVERIAWSEASEADALAAAHIGIMPLTDDEWSRGKCAFKLLQYMAASLPCVASPIGANTEAVIDGVNGFHAATVRDWESRLEELIVSPELRARFGAGGLDARGAALLDAGVPCPLCLAPRDSRWLLRKPVSLPACLLSASTRS